MTQIGKNVIVLGGQGDPLTITKAIVDANRADDTGWEIAGFLNDVIEIGSDIGGFRVLGTLGRVSEFVERGYYFLNGIYRIDGNARRIAMFENLGIPDSRLVSFIHPSAYVAPGVVFGPGCIVMPNVCISHQVHFGKCCIVLQGATVGHDNSIGDYAHISAQACLGAYLDVGRGVHFGMNSTVREKVRIGNYAAIGMGSVLLKSVGEAEIWAGNPARLIRAARLDD